MFLHLSLYKVYMGVISKGAIPRAPIIFPMTLFLVEIPKFLDQQLGGACRCKASRIHHEEGGMARSS